MQKEAVFKLKSMFKPDNPVSSWILKLSLMRNDMFYVYLSLIDYVDGTKKANSGEFVYFFRLAASHYREAVKYIAHENKKKEINEFVSELSTYTIEQYEKLLKSCTPWKDSFVEKHLKPIRDSFFHYDNQNFDDQYKLLEDFYTKLIITGKTRKEVDLVYADELAVNLIFGDLPEEGMKSVLSELSAFMSALIAFVDEAIGAYFNNNKGSTAFMITIHK